MLGRKITQLALRIYDPDYARRAIKPDAAGLPASSARGMEDFVEVHDNGSDVTIFSFAGGAALYAGLPTFEFRRILQTGDNGFNLVFLRDVHRLNYHLTPDGQKSGLQFYEEQIASLLASLKSSYNVTIGLSAGGSAALYFGIRCGMQQVLAFSPAYPLSVYTKLDSQIRTYGDVRRLLHSPKAYAELILVTLASLRIESQLKRTFGAPDVWNVLGLYRTAPARPQTTIFYGAHCRPDRNQAQLFDDIPNVRLAAIPTEYHNCTGYLKVQGALGQTILDEIRTGQARPDREIVR